MMSRRVCVWMMIVAPGLLGCATADVATADPEAQRLSPPVIIVDDPEPEPSPSTASTETLSPAAAKARDPNTEVITFTGADASPGMADEVTAAPKRDPLPSMMSDVLHGPR